MTLLDRFNSLPAAGIDPADSLSLRRGHYADYLSLSRFHYRAGQPATICTILALIDADCEPVACLVVSRPTLNAWWRTLAWPGRFDIADKREAAARINADLRTISRVIIDPRYRGIGLARRLVETHLADPLTPCTEALAAMGRACPFFERAGMTAHRKPISRRDSSLLRALRALREKPSSLLHPTRSLHSALRSWANDARATRHLTDIHDIARAAAAAILTPPMAYTSPPRGPTAGGGPCPIRSALASSPTSPTCSVGSRPIST